MLGMLLETDALEFVGSDYLRRDACGSLPLVGSEDTVRLIALQQFAHHLGALGHEESLAATVFLLLQLPDEFYLVFTDHFPKSR